MSCAVQLLRGRESSRTRTNHGDFLASPMLRRLRLDPPLIERMLDNALLDLLDGDRRLVDAEHARRLAWGRADAAGELGEIVRRVKLADRILPAVTIDEIIPIGNDVVDR